MPNLPDFRSVHPYLNYAADFIADMETHLSGPEKMTMLDRQRRALEAIEKAIAMLSPGRRCPAGQQAITFNVSARRRAARG